MSVTANSSIRTSTYCKLNTGNTILHAISHHPKHIPVGKMLHARRNCSSSKDFVKEVKKKGAWPGHGAEQTRLLTAPSAPEPRLSFALLTRRSNDLPDGQEIQESRGDSGGVAALVSRGQYSKLLLRHCRDTTRQDGAA